MYTHMSTDKKSIEWYDENAEAYTAHVRDKSDSIYHSLYEKPAMYGMLPDLHGKRVLSLGCGSGEDSEHLKKQGATESIGIDISTGLIEIAQKSYPECTFEVMDMEKLPFPDNSFDFAYSSLAIHYLEDWTSVFRETHRILKPNASFLFSCNHPITSAATMHIDGNLRERMLGTRTWKGENKGEVIGNYFERHHLGNSGNGFDVVTWHKQLGEIIGEVFAAGFTLDTLLEPKPLKEMKETSPHNYEKLSKIPFFLIIRLQKNGKDSPLTQSLT